MTADSNRPVRWLVILALSAATAGMFLISMRANYLYGRSIGQSAETREALAWANVGADAWKAFGLIVVTALWRGRWRRAAITTALTWFVCLLFSLSSAIGIYVQERTALTGGRAATHASYDDARQELTGVEARLKGRVPHRSTHEVEAAIAALLAQPVIVADRVRGTVAALSENCSKEDRRITLACAEIAALRQELAVAAEGAKLEARAVALRRQINELRDKGAIVAPDPIAEFWAWLSRGWLTVQSVGFGLPLFFALMIEAVSAFGPLAIVSYAEATRRATDHDMSRPVAADRALSGPTAVDRHDPILIEVETGTVVQFMAERTEPSAAAVAVSIELLHAAYEDWCRAGGRAPLPREDFAVEFDRVREAPQLNGRIRKSGTRYYGISIVGREVRSPPTRKRGNRVARS